MRLFLLLVVRFPCYFIGIQLHAVLAVFYVWSWELLGHLDGLLLALYPSVIYEVQLNGEIVMVIALPVLCKRKLLHVARLVVGL